MKIRLLSTLILLLSLGLFAQEFSSFTGGVDYPEVMQTITDVEKREFSKIAHKDGLPVFNDKLIKLYLVASEINSEPAFSSYFNSFEKLVQELKSELSKEKLNSYNRAEKILHLLHDKQLKVEITGSGAGYNVGIQETLDDKLFNCYKSALLYNAVLEYFDYQSYLVLVPEHIYSVLIIDGNEIAVETTNRYGFDPYDDGAPTYKRKFDKANIVFNKTSYTKKEPIDNVSVVSIIYNNRMLLYEGEKRYSGLKVATDFKRAAALGLLGLYLYPEDKALTNNIHYPFYIISRNSIKDNPLAIEKEHARFQSLLALPYFTKRSEQFKRNFSIEILEALPHYRQAVFGDENMLSLDDLSLAYAESLAALEQYSMSHEITATGWNNSVIHFIEALDKRIAFDSLDALLLYGNACKKLFSNEKIGESAFSARHQSIAEQSITIKFNNYIAKLITAKEYTRAYREGSRGVKILSDDLNFYDEKALAMLQKNIKLAEKYQQ